MTKKVAVMGVGGRMGMQLVKAIHEASDMQLAAAIDHPDSQFIGKDAGSLAGVTANGIAISSDLRAVLSGVDVVIDFSRAEAVAGTADACATAGAALMVGTTGLDAAAKQRLAAAAGKVPVLVSANTSLALNVLLDLVERAAGALPAGYDIEIFEAHHRHKVDAPSGTALALGEAATRGRGEPMPARPTLTGAQTGARAAGGVGYSVVRGGDVVGEHDVRFLGAGEQLRLMHVATDRAIFARGAVAAAAWLAGRPPGSYRMADFLFQKQ